MLPPLPSWDGLHPIIVHFPIALFLVVPLLILIGIFMPRRGRSFLTSAFILMLIGTIATWVAVSTGEQAGELAERMANVEAVLENHEELAETTRNVFTALTVIFGTILLVPLAFRKPANRETALVAGNSPEGKPGIFSFSRAQKIMIPLCLGFLLFYSAGLILLVNTAHEGGRLVHEFGVRAVMSTTAQNTGGPPPAGKTDDDDD